MDLFKKDEIALCEFVKKVFGDDEWDVKHTFASVEAMKKILSKEGGNEKLLVTTMYLHDLGYAGQLKKNYSLEERIEAKKSHMERGAKIAREILPTLNYSTEEVKEITRLILVHDKLDELSSRDELLVLEADSLAQIDPKVGNGFGEDEFSKYVEIFERKRAPKFFTKTGKELLKKFAQENKLFWKYTKIFK